MGKREPGNDVPGNQEEEEEEEEEEEGPTPHRGGGRSCEVA